MYKDHVIDEENLLDTIEYGYSDFFTLQIRGTGLISSIAYEYPKA